MNFEYRIVREIDEKSGLKDDFQAFFLSVFGKPLDDKTWEHQFLRSPYENSSLFLAENEGKIVGSALMIPQKLVVDGSIVDYYLYTTSAILKEYRAYGVYAELLAMQRKYCKENDKAFIFAFPNKTAYAVLKLFGGFKDLQKTDLVKAKMGQLSVDRISNSLLIDKPMIDWRFEHNTYKYLPYKGHVVVAKEYEGDLYVLAVYDENSISGLELQFESIGENQSIITLEMFLEEGGEVDPLREVRATYFPIDSDFDKSGISINLLMSDVF